jgi:hypothetical protein
VALVRVPFYFINLGRRPRTEEGLFVLNDTIEGQKPYSNPHPIACRVSDPIHASCTVAVCIVGVARAASAKLRLERRASCCTALRAFRRLTYSGNNIPQSPKSKGVGRHSQRQSKGRRERERERERKRESAFFGIIHNGESMA